MSEIDMDTLETKINVRYQLIIYGSNDNDMNYISVSDTEISIWVKSAFGSNVNYISALDNEIYI